MEYRKLNNKFTEIMEDSGFDSEERLMFMTLRNNESSNSSNDDILKTPANDEVLYRNPSLLRNQEIKTDKIRTDYNNKNPMPKNVNEHNKKLSNINTCKGLQRKLELKVEKVKKTLNAAHLKPNDRFNQIVNSNDSPLKKSSDNLIPINRLQFPRHENQPLIAVELKTDSDEENTFFPREKRHKKLRPKRVKHQDVEVDTFSIQEMTIIESDETDGNDGDESGSEGDLDSQLNLELLPPKNNVSLLDKFKKMVCCTNNTSNSVF